MRQPLFIVWASTFGRLSPQLIYDAFGDAPFLDDGIKQHVVTIHRLKDSERALSFDDLAKRYPAPALKQAEDGK